MPLPDSPASSSVPAVSMRGITKVFPRVVANRDVDLSVEPGEIHALIGENGAGKSTLMKILYGLQAPDAGTVRLFGAPLHPHTPAAAIRAGLGMVHQHFMLLPPLTVAENVVLGQEPARLGVFLDRDRAEAELLALSERYRLSVDPRARVESLSVGQEQRVEILKVLYRGARVLILDEPTAVLTPPEVEELYAILRALKAEGKTVLFISHKLAEVMAVTDRVTVMRRGEVAGRVNTRDTSREELARLMVGRPVLFAVEKPPARPGAIALRVQGLSALGHRELPAVRDVSFDALAGEILGIAGVEGNGQTELIEVLTGLREATAGSVELAGQEILRPGRFRKTLRARPNDLLRLGMGHVPEDRHKRGLVLDYSVADNLVLGRHRLREFNGFLLRRGGALLAHARERIASFDIRPPDPHVPARALSGGNQQKIVVARELARDPRVLLACQPTRGVDIGAIESIHRRLIEERERGKSILLVSAELSEILSLADRIAVMYGGRIVGTLDRIDANEERLGQLMTGGAH
ncbi:MAG: ABC transporter ATP-binding protein [Planctomycetes bacterium]|nr:ABC transporter ATP-binding protein [Planctomycetota bacterium]